MTYMKDKQEFTEVFSPKIHTVWYQYYHLHIVHVVGCYNLVRVMDNHHWTGNVLMDNNQTSIFSIASLDMKGSQVLHHLHKFTQHCNHTP